MDKKFYFIVIFFSLIFLHISLQESLLAQNRNSLNKRVVILEKELKVLSDKVRLLEALVNELQQKYPPGSIQALQQLLVERNKDGILNELHNLASSAYQFRIRPSTMGGGGGNFIGFKIPSKLTVTEFAAYSVSALSDEVFFTARSVFGLGTVSAKMGADGKLGSFIYSGDFE